MKYAPQQIAGSALRGRGYRGHFLPWPEPEEYK